MKSLFLVAIGVFAGAMTVEMMNRKNKRKQWIVKSTAKRFWEKWGF
jgi:hypothetical protein